MSGEQQGLGMGDPSSPGQQVLSNMELTILIISFLGHTSSEADGEVSDDHSTSLLPAISTSNLARLARVNRVFFHASVDVLWETMGSIKPLLALLGPDFQEDGEMYAPASFFGGIEPQAWERFDIYSGRVKTLTLKANLSPNMDPCWFMFLSTARTRSCPLFPSVKRLLLDSYDSLSVFLAFTLLPQLKFLGFNPTTPNESTTNDELGVALCAGLAVHSCLTTLHITISSVERSHGAVNVRTISRIHSLTSLRLHIDDAQDAFDDLKYIENLKMLETLAIIQPVVEDNDDAAGQFPSMVDTSAPISRVSKLTRLRELEVRASSTMQFMVAAQLSPRSLETLTLEILPYNHNQQMVLIPHFLTIHTTRNPRLRYIWVHCPVTLPFIDPESIEHMRGDSRYHKRKAFLTALGNLVDLTSLTITEIPFFSVDINIEMLKVLPKLQQLEKFRFRATSMTALETDELVLPLFDTLEEVSRRNPRLVEFETNMDMTEMPTIPEDYVSTHRLQSLMIPTPYLRDGEELEKVAFTEEETFFLARYIDRLFPFLGSLVNTYQDSVDYWWLWKPVEKQMFFAQQIRRDVEGLKA